MGDSPYRPALTPYSVFPLHNNDDMREDSVHPKGPMCSRTACETTDVHRRCRSTSAHRQNQDRSPSDSYACSFSFAILSLCPNVKGRGVPLSWERYHELVGTLC